MLYYGIVYYSCFLKYFHEIFFKFTLLLTIRKLFLRRLITYRLISTKDFVHLYIQIYNRDFDDNKPLKRFLAHFTAFEYSEINGHRQQVRSLLNLPHAKPPMLCTNHFPSSITLETHVCFVFLLLLGLINHTKV